MSSEASPPKRRKIRCGHCGEEGHNKISCLQNAQASSSNQPANIQPSENHGHTKVSRRWRDIGEIDDENVEEDSQIGHKDIDEEDAAYDMDDWSTEELEWEDWLPSVEPPPEGQDARVIFAQVRTGNMGI